MKRGNLEKSDYIRIIGKPRPETLDEHIKIVEYRMGMTIDDFHRRIKTIITPEYIAEGERYYGMLNEWLKSKKPITTRGKKRGKQELVLSENEYFVPCFHPDESVRNEMPNYWFISNKGNLVALTKGGKVYLVKPTKPSKKGRSSYKPKNQITGKTSSIMTYDLLWSVFNRDCAFGRAGDYVDQFGSYAFGVKGDPFNVEGHHKERFEHYPEKINDPYNIQVLTVFAHDILQTIRKIQDKMRLESSEEKKLGMRNKIVKLLSKLSAAEAPDTSVLVNSGERYDKDGAFKDNKGIYDYNAIQLSDILFSQFALQQITLLAHGKDVHKKISRAVLRTGIEKFTEEQIIVISYENEIDLPFTVIKTDECHVNIKLVPLNEIEEKEVYIYYEEDDAE